MDDLTEDEDRCCARRMTSGIRGPAVIDTGVFAARLTPSGSLLAARYRPLLAGRPAVISFVTVAELGYGARLAGWGPGKLRRLEYEIARAEIVWPPSLGS
jgi:predicted nucleic acid-binding protein